MDENEFKKLTANSRDWLIYQLLSERSKEVVVKEIDYKKPFERVTRADGTIEERQLEVVIEKETTVHESIVAEVGIITEKAVGVINHDGSEICWIPKSAIKNLAKIAIQQGKTSELVIADWFQSKVEWVKNKPRG